jgi:nucleotide-binding universal stress UspA family protein
MLRDLLVHVDGSPAGRQRAQFAFDLAARAGARVTGLHITPPVEIRPLYKPSVLPRITVEVSTQLMLDASAAAAIFSEETNRLSADASWLEATGDVVDGISDKARYADLVILGQYEWQGGPEAHPLPIAHSVVLQCGRPVMVVPASFTSRSLARIAIAWDASREAVRAVHDALPLLRLSQSVELISVTRETDLNRNVDAVDLSRHLSNHQIDVKTNIIKSADEQTALREELQQGGYDLIIMGGYSHPIWLEFIVGGATQSILLSSKIPVLVSH